MAKETRTALQLVAEMRKYAPDLAAITISIVPLLDGWDVILSGPNLPGVRERLIPIVEMLREKYDLPDGDQPRREEKTAQELQSILKASDPALRHAYFQVGEEKSAVGWTATVMGSDAANINSRLKQAGDRLGKLYALKK